MSEWRLQSTPIFENFRNSNKDSRDINGICLVDNYLYFTDQHILKRVNITNGECIAIAGCEDLSGDRLGFGSEARFNIPWGVTVDKAHKNAYIADWDNHKIKRVDLETKEVFTLAGSTNGFVNGETGESTKLSTISRLVLDESTNLLYVLEFGNSVIRVMHAETGKTSTLCSFHPESSYLTIYKEHLWISKRGSVVQFDVKTGDSVTIRMTNLSDIRGIVFDKAGTLYLGDNSAKKLFKVHIKPNVTEYEAQQLLDPYSNFKYISALAMDRKGNLYVVDQGSLYFVRRPLAIPWNLERLLWIAKLKNEPSTCLLASLPKEMIREIIACGNSL